MHRRCWTSRPTHEAFVRLVLSYPYKPKDSSSHGFSESVLSKRKLEFLGTSLSESFFGVYGLKGTIGSGLLTTHPCFPFNRFSDLIMLLVLDLCKYYYSPFTSYGLNDLVSNGATVFNSVLGFIFCNFIHQWNYCFLPKKITTKTENLS